MQYISTRDQSVRVSAAQAVVQGLSRESGLFVPESLPALKAERLRRLVKKSYIERAADILGDFFEECTSEEITACVHAAYSKPFPENMVAPVHKLCDDTYVLELFHGPTCAFKDMALQLLPHLLTLCTTKTQGQGEIVILTATSGDTGKAALEGFCDVPGTRVFVFYPQDGVSQVQKLQMVTQEGANVGVCGVDGNFDDAQAGVKAIFSDAGLRERLAQRGFAFSSANSINWGRLAPQIVYYISAYCDMVRDGEIEMGESINVAVPTGNFGNILAAHYAKSMGLPISRLICASNVNNVLTDFIRTGVYDRRRPFHMTSSPSMDILVSSNLERLLFALCQDDQTVAANMTALAELGCYTVSDAVRAALDANFYGGFCDEQTTRDTIRDTYVQRQYLCDPHTAVALAVREDYLAQTGDTTKTLVVSTASPYKFSKNMLYALRGVPSDLDEFTQAEQLSTLTRTPIPAQILALKEKPVRFQKSCGKTLMADYVLECLGL